ncbi:PAS domain-containing sensor histidine kinase [Flavobacterium enshiense]|uniref:ATP-binding protein n=1 Tax=Flavobacterium enshiense TaxID=1341165 RepID=UPI00345D828A
MGDKIVINKITAKKDLNQSNSKYSVFDNMMEGVQVIDFEWRYIYANSSLAKQGLTTIEAMLGRTMMEMYPGIENSSLFKYLETCMYDRNPIDLLNEFDFPDGSKGWFELSIQPIPEGVLVLSSDITKLKKTEVELKQKLTERIEMLGQITQQKKQLEEFCQIIAHNLRAPLSNLLFINDLITESQDIEEKLQYIEMQKPVLDLLHKTFEELVDATQVRMDYTIKRNDVDLEKKTLNVINALQKEIEELKAIVTYDFTEMATVLYSKKYMESIIRNLVSNALKYHSFERIPKIHITSFKKEGWVCISVKDNGLGINLKENQNDLFKLHKTFHSHPKAKGYGLFLTKTQVEALGGSIQVKSQINKGSTFTVKLYKMSPDEED